MKVSTKLCPADKKPDISKIDPVPCNPHECNPYSWVSSKGVCSVTCGRGKYGIRICNPNFKVPLRLNRLPYECTAMIIHFCTGGHDYECIGMVTKGDYYTSSKIFTLHVNMNKITKYINEDEHSEAI